MIWPRKLYFELLECLNHRIEAIVCSLSLIVIQKYLLDLVFIDSDKVKKEREFLTFVMAYSLKIALLKVSEHSDYFT